MRISVFPLGFWLLLSSNAFATTLPRLPLNSLHKKADAVVVVQIESGEIVKSGEQFCGVKYSGRVLESIKGPLKNNDVIEFGPYAGKGIGDKALLLLNDSAHVYRPRASTNSIASSLEAEYRELCMAVMPRYSIMFDGFGFFDISLTAKFNYKEAIIFKDKWVASPPELERKLRQPGDSQIESEEYWVKVDDVVTYLKNLESNEVVSP